MSKKLYIGNLPFSFTKDDLMDAFSQFGDITEATVISDKYSGRSKGFGFVTFAEDSAADKAVAEMDGKQVGGREIRVSEAKPMEPREPRAPRGEFRSSPRRHREFDE